jgi:hypothetical protein
MNGGSIKQAAFNGSAALCADSAISRTPDARPAPGPGSYPLSEDTRAILTGGFEVHLPSSLRSSLPGSTENLPYATIVGSSAEITLSKDTPVRSASGGEEHFEVPGGARSIASRAKEIGLRYHYGDGRITTFNSDTASLPIPQFDPQFNKDTDSVTFDTGFGKVQVSSKATFKIAA